MKLGIKKFLLTGLALVMILGSVSCGNTVQKNTEFNGVTVTQAVSEMGLGWNLGNTLDACQTEHGRDYNGGFSTETSWGMPKTTQEMIKSVKSMGFSSIRLPVSWHSHIIDRENITVDPTWIARVKEIVDWCMEEDLYVIINIHHDTSPNLLGAFGYFPDERVHDQSVKFISRVWQQVAQAFNEYDHHLIFETLNEPRARAEAHEWNCNEKWLCKSCKKVMAYINEYNQLAVDTIRATGGNNASRFIMVPSIAANYEAALAPTFKLPKDPAGNLILSVHMYTPYDFAMNVREGSYDNFQQKTMDEIDFYFNKLDEKFVKNGVPVVIGEMGATNKHNLEDREKWMAYFMKGAHSRTMAAVLWDNAIEFNTATPNESFGQLNRRTMTWFFPTMIKAGVDACK